ncbi:methyltransferase domain-containing protein [Candidatus Omnitrophota bacterium]
MEDKKIIKVNVGCGPNGKEGWINLDWGVLAFLAKARWLTRILVRLGLLSVQYDRPWPGQLRLHDCRKKLPFNNQSLDFIYTSHFLEHLPRYQAVNFLAECKRALRPAGVLRVSVPDLKKLAEKYIQVDKVYFLNILKSNREETEFTNIADLFVQYFYGYDTWREPDFLTKIKRKFVRGHLWMYDYNSLEDMLKLVGFFNIRRCQPASGRTPDLDFLDIHRVNSIFVEANY